MWPLQKAHYDRRAAIDPLHAQKFSHDSIRKGSCCPGTQPCHSAQPLEWKEKGEKDRKDPAKRLTEAWCCEGVGSVSGTSFARCGHRLRSAGALCFSSSNCFAPPTDTADRCISATGKARIGAAAVTEKVRLLLKSLHFSTFWSKPTHGLQVSQAPCFRRLR